MTEFVLDVSPLPALGSGDRIPAGPYTVGKTVCLLTKTSVEPFVIRAANGQTVAGHIPSREIADSIVEALNVRR